MKRYLVWTEFIGRRMLHPPLNLSETELMDIRIFMESIAQDHGQTVHTAVIK